MTVPRNAAETANGGELLALLSGTPGLAIVQFDAGGTIAWADAGAERLFGFKAAALAGRPHGALHPDGALGGAFDGKVPAEIETQAFAKGGAEVPVAISLRPAADGGWLALYRDLTPQKRLAQELEEARGRLCQSMRQSEKEAEFLWELLAHTIETVQIGLAVQDAGTGMIAYVNEGFEAITGLHKMDLMGAGWSHALAEFPDARERLMGFVEKIRAAAGLGEPTPPPAHWEVDLPAGKKNLELYGRMVMVEGHENQYILLIIEDNTQRHRLQMQLVQSEKLAAIGQLAAGIAHEIRNPLTTIYNALFDLNEIIAEKPPDVAEDIDISMEEIKRVQEIINNLLDFARESERARGEASINDALQRTVRLVQHDLSNKRIAIELKLGRNLPDAAISSNAIKQILINLITNAAQAMPEGGTLSIRTSKRPGLVPLHGTSITADKPRDENRVRLASTPRDASYKDHLVIEVADTGTGIPAEILRNIFNPFFTTKEPGSGTGLGLSVVHSLVRDAGGAVAVSSRQGAGTTFTIELPGAGGD